MLAQAMPNRRRHIVCRAHSYHASEIPISTAAAIPLATGMG